MYWGGKIQIPLYANRSTTNDIKPPEDGWLCCEELDSKYRNHTIVCRYNSPWIEWKDILDAIVTLPVHDDDKTHDYVITVDEPTRIYYGPSVIEDINCFRTEDDEADTVEGEGTPLKEDTAYRTLNHNCLAKNKVVIAAGRVKKNGNNLTFDNLSGHYKGDLTQDKQDYIRSLVSMIQPDYTCNFEENVFPENS